MKPTVGRIVITDDGFAAMITRAVKKTALLGDPDDAEDAYDVSLCVFKPWGIDFLEDRPFGVHGWHWPERVTGGGSR